MVTWAAYSILIRAKLDAEVRQGPQIKIIEDRPGSGKLIEDGDKVVIQYRVWDVNGRELADTSKRGMPFTMVIGQRNSDKLLTVALAGMHAKGVRTADIPAELVPAGLGSVIPANSDLHIWIFAVAAKPASAPDTATQGGRPVKIAPKPAKVESKHVERTKGTVQVPGATAHNGPART